jgi:hypothetical protein
MSRFRPAAIRPTKPHPMKLKRRFSAEQVAKIRALPWEKGSGRALAREFGVSGSLISVIRHGYAYKEGLLETGYSIRVTDGRERYSLGPFHTPEAAEHARQQFEMRRSRPWPRGSVERNKGRWRSRLSLGVYDTRWEAEAANRKACEILRSNTNAR